MAEIETERLWLRPWRPDDEAHLVRLFTDPEVMRYISGRPLTLVEVAEVAERTLEQWERNGFGPWAAVEKATGRWVGRIGLNELPDWARTRSRLAGSWTRPAGAVGLPPRAGWQGCATASRWWGWSASSA